MCFRSRIPRPFSPPPSRRCLTCGGRSGAGPGSSSPTDGRDRQREEQLEEAEDAAETTFSAATTNTSSESRSRSKKDLELSFFSFRHLSVRSLPGPSSSSFSCLLFSRPPCNQHWLAGAWRADISRRALSLSLICPGKKATIQA